MREHLPPVGNRQEAFTAGIKEALNLRGRVNPHYLDDPNRHDWFDGYDLANGKMEELSDELMQLMLRKVTP